MMKQEKEYNLNTYKGYLKITEKHDNYQIVEADSYNFITYDFNDYYQGDIFYVEGDIKRLEGNAIPLISDFKSYMKSKNISNNLVVNSYVYKRKLKNGIDKNKIINKILSNHDEETKKFIKMIVFGDKIDSQELYNDLKNLSVIHLFVISGFHINVLFIFLKKLGSKYIKNDILILLLIFPYIFLLGYTIPSLRAYLTICLRYISKRYLKNYLDSFSIIFLLAFFFLFINPLNIKNISFILTFFASFNILLINKLKFKLTFLKPIYFSSLTYLAMLPIILYLNYEFNAFAIILNIIFSSVIPFIYLISILGIIPYLQFLLLPLIHGFYQIINIANEYSQMLIMGKPSINLMLIYYSLYYFFINYFLIGRKKLSLKVFLSIIVALVFQYYKPYFRFQDEVSFIDVGQGDCTLINYKNNLGNILIDTGGSSYYDYATKRIIPYLKAKGIKSLDYVIISHDDFDHNGALPSLLTNFKVKKVYNRENFETIKIKNEKIININNKDYSNNNDNSLVIYLKACKLNFLFTGDISSIVEKNIIQEYPTLKVDVLKISHHGSKTSSSEEFLEVLKPILAVISVGKNNFYGHPSIETLARLNKMNIKYYRTDLNGTIIITKMNNYILKIKEIFIN
ncbi:MAG: DNA internalization-related competence protein ComEC/Rec2 [Bacilli bacterium]|nr:DNA internalization-related competence protein ComEC/Rec2 [Bacilli bacterium]